MVKEEQSSNPQNLNAETSKNTKEGKLKSKQSSDLIWELFDTGNTELDSSDIDLRHALANMIAVVFSLPDRSTHLWYHMFAPGDLKNSYLTGCMVCLITLIFITNNVFVVLFSIPEWLRKEDYCTTMAVY